MPIVFVRITENTDDPALSTYLFYEQIPGGALVFKPDEYSGPSGTFVENVDNSLAATFPALFPV